MWNVTDKQLAAGIRQGDILIVPAKGKPANAEAKRSRRRPTRANQTAL
jgi:hypothetical protein